MKQASLLVLLCLWFSCVSDNSGNIPELLRSFSINGQNTTTFQRNDPAPDVASSEQDFVVAMLGEKVEIKVELPEDNKTPVLWEIDGRRTQGRRIEEVFNTTGFKLIALQFPGQEEVIKYVKVEEKNYVDTLPASQDDIAVNNQVDPLVPEPGISNKTDKTIQTPGSKSMPAGKAPDKPVKAMPQEVSLDRPGPPEHQPVVIKSAEPKPKVTQPAKTDFRSAKTEGARIGEICADNSYVASATVNLYPTQDAELASIFVYANQAGTVNIQLLENGSLVDGLSGRSVNKGTSEIRLSTLNYTLRSGRTYTLRVNGVGGVTLANLSKCNSGGSGSILNPAYSTNLSIFNIKFNY